MKAFRPTKRQRRNAIAFEREAERRRARHRIRTVRQALASVGAR